MQRAAEVGDVQILLRVLSHRRTIDRRPVQREHVDIYDATQSQASDSNHYSYELNYAPDLIWAIKPNPDL